MATMIGQGKVKEAHAKAYYWTNPRYVPKVLTEEKLDDIESEDLAGDDCNSFDVVAIIKRETDEYDPNYIYRLNNGSMNNGSDYVFLSSTKMAELAVKMDVNGEKNCLQDEPAYFDGTFHRDYGFVSFALWLFHPTLKKILCLANM